MLKLIRDAGYASYASSYGNAVAGSSNYYGPNKIVQNQENAALELGEGSDLVQSNDAKAIVPKLLRLDPLIIQNQANLGTLISTC